MTNILFKGIKPAYGRGIGSINPTASVITSTFIQAR
jgi:hypothetical protein